MVFKDRIKTGARFLIAQSRIMHEQNIPLVLLGILVLIPLTFAVEETYCTSRMLLASEVRNCQRSAETSLTCQITTKGLITL